MDKLGNRYLRREALRERVSVEELWGKFPKVLPEADRIVNLWTEIDLQQAG